MSFELDGYAVYEDAGPEKGGEHTYVYCRETKRFYNCWGNHVGPKVYDAEGHLVGKKKGVSDHRQLCEATAQDLDPLSFFDTTAAKVFSGWGWLSGSGGSLGFENGKKHTATAQLYYLWTGVCHQAANRFLFWTDDYRSRPRPEKGHWPKFPPTVKKARFFHLAKLLYGYWGRDKIGKLMHEGKWEEAHEFARDNFDAYERKVDPPVEQEKPEFLAALSAEEPQPTDFIHEQFAHAIGQALGEDFDPESLLGMQAELLERKDATLHSGDSGPSLAAAINGHVGQFVADAASHLDPEQMRLLFGPEMEEEVHQVVRPAIAVTLYGEE